MKRKRRQTGAVKQSMATVTEFVQLAPELVVEQSVSQRGVDRILLERRAPFSLEAGMAALFRSNFAPIPLFVVALLYLLKYVL